ncbi:hypothetical protein LIER_26419 [Lithospermum erythrorhizon]|uniref:Uncharacterized protein n=1 Tax=Lithospermum erythrorhizon TaxID=34254 RepID=A0AAV3R9S4_LITER
MSSGSSKRSISSSRSSVDATDPDYAASLSSQCSNKNVELKESRNGICYTRKRKNTSFSDVSSSVVQEEQTKNETVDMACENQSTRGTNLEQMDNTIDKKKTRKKRSRCSRGANSRNDQAGGRPATIYAWLIDSKTVKDTRIFQCKEENEKSKNKGKIRRGGIECDCCNELITAAEFCDHSDMKTESPYEKISAFKGPHCTLLSLVARAWEKPEESQRRKSNIVFAKANAADLHDDACMICADGGNLMCCENCNSTYHYNCVDLEEEPEDCYYCPYCVCKFCENVAQENENVLTCPLCARKYHWDCHLQNEPEQIDINSAPCAPYCKKSCKEIFENLEQIVGVQKELGDGYSWTLLHNTEQDSGSVYIEDTYKRTMCHAKLAVAYKLMNDCFCNIKDRHTKIDVLQSVVYNCSANFNRIDFKGFYTAILEKGDEVITAACLRIHGTKLAEMPFVGTSEVYRGRGMCRRLLSAIESRLSFLKVGSLMIPSTPSRISTWTNSYGFQPLEDGMRKEIMKCNTLMFHDSTRLQKPLIPSELSSVVLKETGNEQDAHLLSHPRWEEFLDLNVIPTQL